MNKQRTPHLDHYEGFTSNTKKEPKLVGSVAVVSSYTDEKPTFTLHVSRSMRAQNKDEALLFAEHPDMTPPMVRAYYKGLEIAVQSVSGEEPLAVREIVANAGRDSIYTAAAIGIRNLVLEDFAQSSE